MLIDLHQDLHRHIRWPDQYPVPDQTSIKQLENQDTKLIFTTGELSVTERLEIQVERQVNFYQSHPGWQIIRSCKDLQNCLAGQYRGFIYHVEGLKPLDLYDGQALIDFLDWLHDQGMRSLSLTHTSDNSFAGGNEGDGQLTDKGRLVIDWCQNNGLLLDLAHLNEVSFTQVAEAWNLPILVSHANARSISDTGRHRNMTDWQLDMIRESNGLLGLMLSRNYIKVSRDVTIDDVLRQVEYLISKLGEDKLALGTDFGGCLHEVAIQNLERIDDLPNLYQVITKTFDEAFADKVFYQNAIRWLSERFNK